MLFPNSKNKVVSLITLLSSEEKNSTFLYPGKHLSFATHSSTHFNLPNQLIHGFKSKLRLDDTAERRSTCQKDDRCPTIDKRSSSVSASSRRGNDHRLGSDYYTHGHVSSFRRVVSRSFMGKNENYREKRPLCLNRPSESVRIENIVECRARRDCLESNFGVVRTFIRWRAALGSRKEVVAYVCNAVICVSDE